MRRLSPTLTAAGSVATSPDGAVQLTHAHLAAIVESSDDAIVSKTLTGQVVSWNAAAERLFGYGAQEMIGKLTTAIIPSERLAEEHEIIARIGRGERVDHLETIRLARDGRRAEVSLTISPVRGPTGQVVGAFEVAREIGERKRAERIQAQLAAIVESSDDAIVSKNLDGIIQSWNAAATRIFGHTADEAVGQPITLIIPANLHAEERAIIARVRAGKRVEHFDTVRITKDGRLIPVSLTVSPIHDPNGTVIGASRSRGTSASAGALRKPCARPRKAYGSRTSARMNLSLCWRMSCETRWPRSATRSPRGSRARRRRSSENDFTRSSSVRWLT